MFHRLGVARLTADSLDPLSAEGGLETQHRAADEGVLHAEAMEIDEEDTGLQPTGVIRARDDHVGHAFLLEALVSECFVPRHEVVA